MADTAATAKEETPKPAHPIVVLRDYLTARCDSLRNALPPHMKPERFISAVMTAVQINSALMACERAVVVARLHALRPRRLAARRHRGGDRRL